MELVYKLTNRENVVKEFTLDLPTVRHDSVLSFNITENSFQKTCSLESTNLNDTFIEEVAQYAFDNEEILKFELVCEKNLILTLINPSVTTTTNIENDKLIKRLQITTYK